jgi:lipid A 3-O-deacylase
MTRRRRFLAVAAVLFSVPAAAIAQTEYGAAPPIPTGPPLPPPPAEIHKPTWLEDGPAVIPASAAMSGSAAFLSGDTAWPVTHSGSACNFDEPDAGLHLTPTSLQVLQGAYFSNKLGPPIPTFNYLPVSVRYGWSLGNPLGSEALVAGSWEFLTDVTGATIISDYGHWFAGTSCFLRYNWAEPGSMVIPYCQGGAGVILNDAYHDHSQRAIGQSVEFYLHAEVGLKCMIAPNLSLDIEGGLQHISNADLASRNLGVNAFGGSIGLTYYFPWGAP